MKPLSYKNLDKQENSNVFSDPEDNESDSSDKEENFQESQTPVKVKKSFFKKSKKKEIESGGLDEMYHEDWKIVDKLPAKKVEPKPEPESDSDEYESSDSGNDQFQNTKFRKPVDQRDIFAESSSSEDEFGESGNGKGGIQLAPIKNLNSLF